MNSNHPDTNHSAAPCVMVIFGATGDLTKRKLIPALCNLAQDNLLPKQFAIVGFATNDFTTETFRKMLGEEVPKYAPAPIDLKTWDWLAQQTYYVRGDFQDAEAYKRLREQIEQADKAHNTQGNRFFYLAVAPRFFSPIAKMLGDCGLTKEENGHWARVIVEKPFGHDLESAKQLNQDLKQVLTEQQIYRIDHYLGKETVQNVMVFRFSNNIIEPLWNRNYVDHVQITAAETVGVEHRGGFYETAGALRDMVPNHLFQLLTMTAMEPPISFDADQVRNKQAEVLHAIQPFSPEDVLKNTVRGQYGGGMVDGQRVVGYRSEPDVAPDSNTETFVGLKLQIDNWRWAGVPFYLRTGKRLAQRTTEIVIQFRRTPFILFRNTTVKNLETNRLVIHIQPEEGISLSFGAKVPGSIMKLGLVNMDFDYCTYFGMEHNTGYERLLRDCMAGDATLFQRADMVEAGWTVIQPILDVWRALPARGFPNYAAGSWGPVESEDLLENATGVPGGASAKRNSISGAGPPRRIAPGSSRNGSDCGRSNGCSGGRRRMSDNRANAEVRILPDAAAIAKRAAEEFIKSANTAAKAKGSFSVSLSGGSTPRALYALLASDAMRGQLPWDKMQLFFGDERHVEPTHSDSNFRMATEAMISKAPLKPEQVHRMKAENPDTEQAAREYEQELRSHFHLADRQAPPFDLVLLGMGNEGHTLSLFPGTKALRDNGRLVVRNWVGKLYAERVTLTAPAVNNAAQVIFMVAGADKALALKGVLEGPYEPEQLPAQLIDPKHGRLLWLVDTAAGGMLSKGIRE